MINPASFGYCPESQLANDIKVAAINIFIKKIISNISLPFFLKNSNV